MPTIDPRKADSLYEPLVSFDEWSDIETDKKRWEKYLDELEELKSADNDLLKKAQDVAKRAAAIETGAIEGLYDSDRGFTFTVALQKAMWEATFNKKNKEARNLIESQLGAYDFVLDFATEEAEIIPAWIRELHEKICSKQEVYQVLTEQGWQKQKLPKGEYKSLPNHVINKEDEIHAYAPVDMTPTEMQRFCDELRSDVFKKAHPVLQAAYAHYGLVYIHPFADGNGRVARALASVFTYRAASVPILIFSDERRKYFNTLSKADDGNYREFANFILQRTLDSISLVTECLKTAKIPSISEQLEEIESFYVTKGGYSHDEVDSAGKKLLEGFLEEINDQQSIIEKNKELNISLNTTKSHSKLINNRYRNPVSISPRSINVTIRASKPFNGVTHGIRISVQVPKDCGKDDDLVLVSNKDSNYVLGARMNEIESMISSQLKMRLRVFAERIYSDMLEEIKRKVSTQMNK